MCHFRGFITSPDTYAHIYYRRGGENPVAAHIDRSRAKRASDPTAFSSSRHTCCISRLSFFSLDPFHKHPPYIYFTRSLIQRTYTHTHIHSREMSMCCTLSLSTLILVEGKLQCRTKPRTHSHSYVCILCLFVRSTSALSPAAK